MSSSRDLFGFDDTVPPASGLTDEALAADDKTLRLAAPLVNAERVDAYLRYQQALVTHLEQDVTAMASAHTAALSESGLDAGTYAQVDVVARAYCGRRLTARRLREKLPALQQGTLEQQERAQKAQTELARIEDLEDLERRYGKDAIACLAARAEALLVQHESVARKVMGA